MSLEHTQLDIATLSPAAQRVLAPGPGRMMAAKGLAPLAEASDLLAVLYQLAVDPDLKIAESAAQSAGKLPDPVLRAGLESAVDARVLDYFATKVVGARPELVQIVVLNQGAGDGTVATLCAAAGAELVDLIAQNEERLLRHPAIIGEMYKNPKSRMSTVDRCVELAVHNQIKVPGIPAWDEIVYAVTRSGKKQEEEVEAPSEAAGVDDDAFSQAAAVASEADESGEQKEIAIRDMSIPQKIRLATLGNKSARGHLIRDPVRMVALAAIKSPGVKDNEALKYASNNALHEDVISYIANKREWTKSYSMKTALVNNAKTPLPAAMRLVPHLRLKDIQQLARSKRIPTALATQAKRLLSKKSGR